MSHKAAYLKKCRDIVIMYRVQHFVVLFGTVVLAIALNEIKQLAHVVHLFRAKYSFATHDASCNRVIASVYK